MLSLLFIVNKTKLFDYFRNKSFGRFCFYCHFFFPEDKVSFRFLNCFHLTRIAKANLCIKAFKQVKFTHRVPTVHQTLSKTILSISIFMLMSMNYIWYTEIYIHTQTHIYMMRFYSLHPGLLCHLVFIAVINGYHLLSIYYVPRTLVGIVQTYYVMRPLMLHFPFEVLDTRNSISMGTWFERWRW